MKTQAPRKISPFAIITLIVNSILFSFYYFAKSGKTSLWILVIIGCLPAICLPIISKGIRARKQMSGKAFEIISLMLGLLLFWAIYFNLTELPLWPWPYILMAIPCIIYAKCFKTVSVEETATNFETNEVATDTTVPPLYCRKCGEKLPFENTSVCAVCGTKTQYTENTGDNEKE